MDGGVGYALAFGAGVASFLSPCVLPLVPAYLSIITGLDVVEIERSGRRHLLGISHDTGLFVAGFAGVFVLLGLSTTTVGSLLLRNQAVLTRVSGLVVLAMALFILGSLVLQAPWMYREMRFHPQLHRFGRLAAPVAGAAFAFGWTPCIGPVLGAVLAVAAATGSPWRGAALLAVYSAGLGVPFLVTGLAFGRVAGGLDRVKRHVTALTVASATALAGFGVLLTFNRLTVVTSQLQSVLRAVGLDGLVTLG